MFHVEHLFFFDLIKLKIFIKKENDIYRNKVKKTEKARDKENVSRGTF